MNSLASNTGLYIGIALLVLVVVAVIWVMSSRSRQSPTAWLMGLGVVVLIIVGLIVFLNLGGSFQLGASTGASKNTPPPPTSPANQGATTTPSTSTTTGISPHTSNSKWAELQKIAKGLLPDCLQGAGLNNAWDYMVVSDPIAGPNSLVVAFVLITPETAQKYKNACKEPNLGEHKEGSAFVALFAQALRPAQLDLGQIKFAQDDKSYNLAEYLVDDQRSDSERWVPQGSPWLTILGNFPNSPYLLADLPAGVEGESVGLIALPTGQTQDGHAILLDPTRSFQVYEGDQSVTLSKP